MVVESKINNSKQHYWFAIILISILGIGLRLYQLDRPLGGGDENALLLYYGYTSFNFIISTYFDPDNHIFQTLLLNSMATLFGDNNAFAIRFPNFIFGIADLWMTYLLSFLIFRSRFIAVSTLLLVAINPVHIHFSQTARGYGIMMFFSTSVIYATLKLLNLDQIYKWSLVFVICGFLSIYTLPTNIYLFIGLAVWLSVLLIHPFWGNEYNDDFIWKIRIAKIFFILYVVLVSLTCIAYLPIIDQMLQTMKNHQLTLQHKGSEFYWILGLIPKVPQMIFPSLMQLFIPFIIVGIVAAKPVRNGYKWLLIITFFIPFCFNLLVGTAGFPRNYFFNFSLINIFLAGGIIYAGQWCNKKLPILTSRTVSSIVISIFRG